MLMGIVGSTKQRMGGQKAVSTGPLMTGMVR